MAERRFGKGAWAGDLGLGCVDGDRLLDNSELKLANAAYELGKVEERERLAEELLRGGHFFPAAIDDTIRKAIFREPGTNRD